MSRAIVCHFPILYRLYSAYCANLIQFRDDFCLSIRFDIDIVDDGDGDSDGNDDNDEK